MAVTDETSQPERSPSKEKAPKNMLPMLVTDETSQPEMSPSKVEAKKNILFMLVTDETSQPLRCSPLKTEVAPSNVPVHVGDRRDVPARV